MIRIVEKNGPALLHKCRDLIYIHWFCVGLMSRGGVYDLEILYCI